MKKVIALVIIIVTGLSSTAQSLQSPEQFFGYKIGTHFTPYYKIANYVKAVAMARADMVKVEKYGETYEGRELLLAYVASPENIKNLEAIRNNNLMLTGLQKGNASTTAPAIVWLSYNVHGNEPSSSEAAMLTLYALVDPSNTKTKEWLKNTVVIIDPCINPDGRDRYVSWFNSVSGKNINADPQSREHSEPWPGGRSNHYNFDLNRDWAWQTQIETRQRMAKYNQWMPQIHVDFHEQGYNAPYYFAPAAEPFHDAITQWQRDFQAIIGKSNAQYFDENGWLYFTKESFDLFYPSYGDTYPLYSGAIGMTYEQGGHSRGGLAVVTDAGDTLTLVDRVTHHYTTGLSTIETASKNAGKLVTEFKKFFDDSQTGKGNTTKTYVITSDNATKLNSIANLLRLNNIAYGSLASNTVFKGFHYSTRKEETGKLGKYSLAISTSQPRSVLARVLLEPSTHLADSVTYDITAWSIPYAYNVDAYAVQQTLPMQADVSPVTKNLVTSSYGYLIRYNSLNSAKVLAQLLKQGIKVRYSEKPFTYNQQVFDRATLIVLQKGNPPDLSSILSSLSASNDVEINAVTTGFMEKGPDFGSADIKFIHAPKVAMITGNPFSATSAGEVWHFFEQQLDYPVTLINANDLSGTNLKKYDVVIFPNGNYKAINDKNIADMLKDFVRSGGNIIAMEDMVQQMASGDWGIKLKDDKDKDDDKNKDDYALLKRYENRERDDVTNSIPGAIYKVQLDNSHPLAFGYTDTYYTLKQDADVYEFLKDGWNVGVLKKDNYIAGFAGTKVKSKLKDDLVFGVLNQGSGTITFLADDPLFREFWEGGKLLFANAVFMVGQ